MPLAILSGVLGASVGGWAGALGQLGISLTANSVLMKYSCDSETEADMVGAQIVYDAGYDPEGLVTFFTKLKQQGGRGGPQFLASHPDPATGRKMFRAPLPAFLQNRSIRKTARNFSPRKQRCPTWAPAPRLHRPPLPRCVVSPRRASPVRTSNRSSMLGYRISYPDNWQLSGSPSASVEIAPQGGSANGTLSYGVLISGFQPKGKAARSMRQCGN